MTDINSNKVIEKLTEVIDLLKVKHESQKSIYEKLVDEKSVDEKCVDEKCVDEKCVDEKCVDEKYVDEKYVDKKCPLRSVMNPHEFEKLMAEGIKKEDLLKIYDKNECNGRCPFMIKKTILDDFDVQKQENLKENLKECSQMFNIIFSLILLVLFVFLLVRFLKGFYCTV